MKHAILFLFIFISSHLFGQYINGPANIREKPKGEVIFSLNDYVKVDLKEKADKTNWHTISIFCTVKPECLINQTILKANSTLYSVSGDSIGYVIKECEVKENHNQNYWRYDELKMISIFLEGSTFKNNIRTKLSTKEILDHKPSYADQSGSSIVHFQNENGIIITEIKQCNYFTPSVKIDGKYEEIILKQTQRIRRMSGVEGQESTIELEFIRDCFSTSPIKKNFTVNADEVKINEHTFSTVRHGCCGVEDQYELYNISSFKKLMDYGKTLYHVEIPNSNIEGFICFQFCFSDHRNIATITFSTPDSIINKVNLFTNDKKRFYKILPFIPEMEFEVINSKDKINYNKNELTL